MDDRKTLSYLHCSQVSYGGMRTESSNASRMEQHRHHTRLTKNCLASHENLRFCQYLFHHQNVLLFPNANDDFRAACRPRALIVKRWCTLICVFTPSKICVQTTLDTVGEIVGVRSPHPGRGDLAPTTPRHGCGLRWGHKRVERADVQRI